MKGIKPITKDRSCCFFQKFNTLWLGPKRSMGKGHMLPSTNIAPAMHHKKKKSSHLAEMPQRCSFISLDSSLISLGRFG